MLLINNKTIVDRIQNKNEKNFFQINTKIGCFACLFIPFLQFLINYFSYF